MQNPSERHKLTSDNNIIKFKKPVHDPYKHQQDSKNSYILIQNYNKYFTFFKIAY